MLTTNSSDELITHPYKLVSGTQAWRQVNFELDILYFLVSYEVLDEEPVANKTSLFWRQRDLLVFCKEISLKERQKITNIVLLSPFSMNHEKYWKFDSIKEIWVVKDPVKKYHSARYVTMENQSFFDPPVSNHQIKFAYERILFSLESPTMFAPDQSH